MAAPSDDDIAQFMKRLASITSVANVNSITLAEQQFVTQAQKMRGLIAVSNAFRSFTVESIDMLNDVWGRYLTSANLPTTWHEIYTWLLPRLAEAFRSLCGAEQQAFAGYPYQAFAQARNIFDSAVMTSAVLQGIVSYQDAEGITPGVPVNPNTIRQKRVATERIVSDKMTGANSGLADATRSELAILDRMFDWETHGQRLSLTQSMDWLQRKGPLHFLPKYEDRSFAPFLNRHLETMWMVHRLLPFMRPHGAPLPDDWHNKWVIIKEALETCAFSLTAQFGKPVGQAVVDFVKAKFPFDAASTISP